MRIYETPEGIEQYCKMAEGYDNSGYRERILKYLPEGKRLLEVGMGPGNDFIWLSRIYNCTGSDYSPLFIDRARKIFPEADLKVLDGVSLDTDERYDGIFSCKVYQHIPLEILKSSLDRQWELLNRDGVIIHSFWIGGKVKEIEDMTFYYHDEEELLTAIEEKFIVVDLEKYSEFDDDDSLFLIGKKKNADHV